jgi:hypothetical protein
MLTGDEHRPLRGRVAGFGIDVRGTGGASRDIIGFGKRLLAGGQSLTPLTIKTTN